jgi:two-component system chemotaxis response regulator CheY
MFPADSKILIVDDSTFARQTMKNSLREMKFWKIVEAADVKTAQAAITESNKLKEPVHLVVTDIHMPELTGLHFLKWIRTQDEYKGLPVIIITSSQDKMEILEAGKLGASSFIIKPYNEETFRERLGATWERFGQKYAQAISAVKTVK